MGWVGGWALALAMHGKLQLHSLVIAVSFFAAFNFMFSFVVSDFTGKFFQMAFISDLISWHCNLRLLGCVSFH